MKLIQSLVAAVLLGMTIAHAAGTVDINSADADTLARELTGIGPSKASAIVEYREKNGPFVTVESLGDVRGIGSRILEDNRQRILISK